MISDREKVEMYERLLHRIQMYYSIVMDPSKVNKLLGNISNWSRSHRVGNGMLSDEEQQERIDMAFYSLLDVEDK